MKEIFEVVFGVPFPYNSMSGRKRLVARHDPTAKMIIHITCMSYVGVVMSSKIIITAAFQVSVAYLHGGHTVPRGPATPPRRPQGAQGTGHAPTPATRAQGTGHAPTAATRGPGDRPRPLDGNTVPRGPTTPPRGPYGQLSFLSHTTWYPCQGIQFPLTLTQFPDGSV